MQDTKQINNIYLRPPLGDAASAAFAAGRMLAPPPSSLGDAAIAAFVAGRCCRRRLHRQEMLPPPPSSPGDASAAAFVPGREGNERRNVAAAVRGRKIDADDVALVNEPVVMSAELELDKQDSTIDQIDNKDLANVEEEQTQDKTVESTPAAEQVIVGNLTPIDEQADMITETEAEDSNTNTATVREIVEDMENIEGE
ncbi:hypothetical protein Droror1_Dr00000113 [Drosera rotundifolia]